MTDAQITALAQHIAANTDPLVVAARTARNDNEVARLYNLPTTFVVWRKNIPAQEVGTTILYGALGAMTSANTDRVRTFMDLNKEAFNGKPDIDAFFATTFSGALASEGQATRDALAAMLRKFANLAERIFATGTGTSVAPGNLGSFEGEVTSGDIGRALNSLA